MKQLHKDLANFRQMNEPGLAATIINDALKARKISRSAATRLLSEVRKWSQK